MEGANNPEQNGVPRWMTQEDREQIEEIENTLRSEDYFGESLDYIQKIYYKETDKNQRRIIIERAEEFIKNNKHSEELRLIARVEAYKGFIDKLKSQGEIE